MGSKEVEDEAPDWGEAMLDAMDEAEEGEDEEGIDLVSNTGLSDARPSASVSGSTSDGPKAETEGKELPNVLLLYAAVSMVKSGELSMEKFVEGVKKLDVVADNALKIYAIPAVKKDLPGKLSEHQNEIVSGLEVEIHRLKEGLALLLSYPQSNAIGDLETGLEIAVKALHAAADIQKNADEELVAIKQREKDKKAQRAQKAAGLDSDVEEDS